MKILCALTICLGASAALASEAAPETQAPETNAPEAKAPERRRLAVYKLDAQGVEDRINIVITDSIVAELRKLEKMTVVGMDEIRAMLDLEAQKQLVGCSDVSCVAEIAEALGVDGVVIGNLAVVGESISFGLKHIDQRSATTLGQATRRIEGTDPANVLATIGPVVEELFPGVPLRPGMTRGVPEEIAFRIHPPPLQPWVFWSLASASAVAVVAGGALTAWNAVAHASTNDKVQRSVTGPPIDGVELNNDLAAVRGSFIGLIAAYSAGALIGAGAGVSALFTDWEGHASGE
jgi:TolB-like protein